MRSIMVYQELIYLITCFKAEQPPELSTADFSRLIRPEGIGFEDMVGHILAVGLPHLLSNIVWHFNRDLHHGVLTGWFSWSHHTSSLCFGQAWRLTYNPQAVRERPSILIAP